MNRIQKSSLAGIIIGSSMMVAYTPKDMGMVGFIIATIVTILCSVLFVNS